jgi:hypothetical protein
MPLTIDQLLEEHKKFLELNPDRPIDIKTYAKAADEMYNTPGERAAGYNYGPIQQISHGIDTAISPVSKLTGSMGRSVGERLDSLVGSDRIAPVLESVAGGIPRVAGEAALTAVSPETQIPRALAYGAKLAGYGSAFSRGYSEHDSSVAGGLIDAATLGVGNAVLPKLDEGAVNYVNKKLYQHLGTELEQGAASGSEELAKVLAKGTVGDALKNNAIRTTARIGAGAVGGAALNEANRQAQLTVDGAPMSERNPFTLENVAGNIAGAAAFAPIQIAAGLRRPGIDTERVGAVANWAESTGRRVEPARDSFESALDTYIGAKASADGAGMQAAKTQMQAAEKVKNIGSVEFMARAEDVYNDAIARGVMPSEFGDLVTSVNKLIDEKNLMTEQQNKDAEFFGRDPEPVGPSSAAVKQLQDKGYLPKITEDYVKERFAYHLERSLSEDPVFGYKALVNEISNHLLSMTDDAKARMTEDAMKTSVAENTPNRSLDRESQAESNYIDSLGELKQLSDSGKIDPEVYKELLDRHLKIVNYIGKSREGIEGSGYGSWREVVTEAVQNYDPETGKTTITLGNKKSGELLTKEIPIEDLVKKNKDGGYVLQPKFRRFKKSQGGRSTLEQADVGATEESQTPSDIAQAQVYEDYNVGDTKWLDEDSRDTAPVEGPNITTEDTVKPSTTPENDVATKLRSTIDTTDNEVLAKKLEPWMRPGRKQEDYDRNKPLIKTALNAVIELQGEKSYLSKESVDFARKMMPETFDSRVAKSGEREAVREATRTYWKSTLASLWKRYRPNEELPKSEWKRYEILLEKVVGEDAIKQLKASPMGASLESTGMPGLQVTEPNPSHRLMDVTSSFRDFFRKQGYEAPLVEHFTNVATRMTAAYSDINYNFAKLSNNDPLVLRNLSGEQKVNLMSKTINDLKIAGVYTGGFMGANGMISNPLIALALDHSNNKDAGVSAFMLSVLGHEMIHGIERSANGQENAVSGPFQEQRVKNYNALYKMAENLSPLEKSVMMETAIDAMFPRGMTDKVNGFLKNAVKTPNEFIATYGQLLILGKVSNTSDNPMNFARSAKEWLMWQPEEVQNFTKGFYRDMSDHAAVLSQTISDPQLREAAGLKSFGLGDNHAAVASSFEDFHNTANEMLKTAIPVETAKRMAGNFVKNVGGFPDTPTAKFGRWLNDGEGYSFIPANFMAKGDEIEATAVKAARDVFWKEKDGQRIGVFSNFMPFFQLLDKLQKQGVELAGDVWNALADVQPGYSRLSERMLNPLLMRTEGMKLKFDKDNPLIRLTTASQKDPKAMIARRALNDILRWQQDNDSTVAVSRRADGSLGYSREAAPFLEQRMASVPTEWQQGTLAAAEAVNKVYQQGKGVLFDSQVSKSAYRVARLIQTLRPTQPYDVNLKIGRDFTNLALEVSKSITDPNVNPIAEFTKRASSIDPTIAELASRYFFEDGGIAPKLIELENLLNSRPGFASEQRPGRFLIESVSRDGEREVDGAESKAHVDLVTKRLQKTGSKIVQVVDKTDLARMTNFDAPDTVYEKAVAAEQSNWNGFLDRMQRTLRPDQIQVLRDEYVPGETLTKEMATKGVGKFMTERRFVGGRDRLDYVDAMRGYVQSLSGSVSRSETRNLMRLMLDDARLDKEVDFKTRALQQLDWVMTPDSEASTKVKTGLAAYYLGGNLSSMLIEGTQSAVTLVPQLLEQGGRGYGLGSAWKTVAQAAREAWSLSSKESFSSYVSAADKVKRGVKLSPDEERTYWFRKALDDGILDHGAIEDLYDRDQRALMARKFGHGDYGDTSLTSMAVNKVYQGTQLLMWAYGKMSNFNQKLAFAAGLKQGQELGLTGDPLYEHARKTKDLSMFGGGKANQPGFLARISNPYTKSTLGVMYTLQQYGLGMTSHLIERGRAAIDTSKTLNPVQRMQARKAFGTMAMTQLALGGALGLPFVGATLAIIEKTTGLNANAAVREGLSSLGGDDSDLGALISESALDGFASHALGVDVGSRVGVSNLLGTSAYRGFSLQDLLGPAPSVIGNMVNGVGQLAVGNKWEGARQLVPQTFKNLVGMGEAKDQYGDLSFRDKSSNLLYEPTTKEAALYAIGFRPRELAQKQRLQSLLKTSDDSFQRANDQTLDEVARAVRNGDQDSLTRYLETNMAQDPMFDVKTATSSIINRAVNMEMPVDVLSKGPSGNSSTRQKIASTFDSSVVDRQSEVKRAIRADQLNAQTGYLAGKPISPRELMRAEMIDSYVARGMTRSDALREVESMGLGHVTSIMQGQAMVP